ncbi:MAG: SusC/RagA family TonB-linked outer membrane protein [Chlorobi bacterium]|nr:SusC/RagA family TonB-linked outer membrane protein [Chlorobiota bacterium]
MMRRLTLILFLATFTSIGTLLAQTRTITGTVTDKEDGQPIPGVSVVIKGTTMGTVTDVNGKYSLNVPNDATDLIFSFVGKKTLDVAIQGKTVIDVQLEDESLGLNEVVVTGVAGATERKKLSVSVASVSAKELEKVPAGSAASALQGKVAGVQVTNLGRPGSGATILLRGAANLYGSQAPLVIMDGVFVEGGLADINIDDIKSFEIVKGASASSLYGSRAGNGVIVLTSKRGKIGTTEVTVRSEIGWSQISHFQDVNLHHPYKLASDWEDYKGKYTKYEGVIYGPNYASVYAATGENAVQGTRIMEDDQYADNPYGVYNDFQDLFFKKGLNNTNYVSINGGNEKVRTFFSYEYNKVDGVLKELDGYNRNTIRFNVDYYIRDWLKFTASNSFIRILDHGTITDFRTITRISPDANVLYPNPDGQPYYYQPDPWENEISNPLYNAWNLDALTKQQRFLGGYKLNIKFTGFLNMDLEYSLENNTSRYTNNRKYETYVRSGDPIGFGYSKGSLEKSSSLNLVQKAQATLNFSKEFGDLDVKAKLSGLLEDRSYDWYQAYGNHYLYSGLPTLDNFKNEDITATSNQTAERAQDYFAIASFVYKDRYILDGLYRRDGSSLFGENERWHDYYRVSGAYRISEDINIPGIQEMKINAARGTAGQRPGFTWQYEMTALSHGTLSTDRIKGNPDLKPSLTTESEIGLNVQFLNRFTFNFAYSYQESTDQFMIINLFAPANAGKNRQWQNVGDLTSNTYEASLNSQIIRSRDWKWNLNINFTQTSSEIQKLNVAQQHVGPDALFLLKEGTEFGSMYGYKFVHDLETMEKQLPDGMSISDFSVNSDGVVVETAAIGTPNEKAFVEVDADGVPIEQKIGNQNANFFLSFVSDLSYKNWDFYMLWDHKNGGDIYNRNTQWNTISGRSAIVDQAGKPDNEKKTVSYYQSLYNVNENMDFWVEDGSYLKLREISLSYTLRSKHLSNFLSGFFKEFKFSAIGRNVLTFTNYSGWDPEVAKYDSGTQQYFSVDYGVYPNQSSYSLSVQLKF